MVENQDQNFNCQMGTRIQYVSKNQMIVRMAKMPTVLAIRLVTLYKDIISATSQLHSHFESLDTELMS